jgi:hypothetical protein
VLRLETSAPAAIRLIRKPFRYEHLNSADCACRQTGCSTVCQRICACSRHLGSPPQWLGKRHNNDGRKCQPVAGVEQRYVAIAISPIRFVCLSSACGYTPINAGRCWYLACPMKLSPTAWQRSGRGGVLGRGRTNSQLRPRVNVPAHDRAAERRGPRFTKAQPSIIR